MKKYIFIALAAFGFATCAEKIDDNSPVHNGELEESYIAINLMSADVDTRAVTDDPYGSADEYGYNDGTDLERSVKSAYFFFFDENGNPFNVLAPQNDGASAPDPNPNAKNYLQLTVNPNHNDPVDDNVSDISNAVLVLKTYKGIKPKQIVAVLNWTPELNKAYSLDMLRTEIYENSLGNDEKGYVMTNSVYMDNETSKQVIDATPITENNIKSNADDAINAPINIYVERTAAKVVVTANVDTFKVSEDNAFKPVGGTERTVYVQLKGWELYNDFNKTNLIKSIDPELTSAELGLTWNDAPYFRSYWARTIEQPQNDSFSWKYASNGDTPITYGNDFPSEYGYEVSINQLNRSNYTYCGENTLAWSESNDVRTKVILKGTLQEKVGDSYQTLELARWYGNEYAGEEDLKKAVASSLVYTLFYYDTDSQQYKSIEPNDIQIVHGNDIPGAGIKAYEVGFQLTNASAGKQWHQYSSEKEHEALTSDQANNILAKIEPAVIYLDGDTYYIVDVEHLGKDNSTSHYGIVRNHVYQIAINSIKGYGSPGYSGLSFVVQTPEYPEDDNEASYVAAKINVLSWKVVQQGVDIVQ